jgi:hypothetical protein
MLMMEMKFNLRRRKELIWDLAQMQVLEVIVLLRKMDLRVEMILPKRETEPQLEKAILKKMDNQVEI